MQETSPPFVNLWYQALTWACKRYTYVAFFDGEAMPSYPYGTFPKLLLAGNQPLFSAAEPDIFAKLKQHTQEGKYIAGYLSYDIKNQVEKLNTSLPNEHHFPESLFFEAELAIRCQHEALEITHPASDSILEAIKSTSLGEKSQGSLLNNILQRTNKLRYIQQVEEIKRRIEEGDVYELNYCMQWEATAEHFSPIFTYIRLRELAAMPFAAFYKLDQHYILSASPERFLKLEGNTIISQPIKGTASRGENTEQDSQKKRALHQSEKERAEHMMIVDLMRNDLTRTAQLGSITVEELFGIYTFPAVHQMISTITALKANDQKASEVLKYAFPMGSMTGAPKIMAMQIIDQMEDQRRGPFSGSIGYLSPEGDFDFNVLIRSIFFNAINNKVSWFAGGAITYDSDPEEEYQEALLKTKSIRETLGLPPA